MGRLVQLIYSQGGLSALSWPTDLWTIGAKPNLYCEAIELVCGGSILQESRLTGSGSPNLVVLVEWKVPVERFMGAANSFR